MSDLSGSNPIGRFTGLADLYAQYRPNYPTDAIDFIIGHCDLHAGSVLVDVGCGTGISSRLFADRGLNVIGIEPNSEMRDSAEHELTPLGVPRPVYRDGTAEATGLEDAVADAVLSAQAFHWFEARTALQEFHRILKPEGWVVLMWNVRDAGDEVTAAYGQVIQAFPNAAGIEGPRRRAGSPLLESTLFQKAQRLAFINKQPLDEAGILGRAFSASYAPKDQAGVEKSTEALREVFRLYQKDGHVTLVYQTSVYLAQK
jgi:SAM-dependent methyltransferase